MSKRRTTVKALTDLGESVSTGKRKGHGHFKQFIAAAVKVLCWEYQCIRGPGQGGRDEIKQNLLRHGRWELDK